MGVCISVFDTSVICQLMWTCALLFDRISINLHIRVTPLHPLHFFMPAYAINVVHVIAVQLVCIRMWT